jgi:hypothetical protein
MVYVSVWYILARARTHTHCDVHSLHVTLGTSLSARHSLQVTLCIHTRTRSMIYIGLIYILSAHVTPCSSLLSARHSLHTHTHMLHDLYWFCGRKWHVTPRTSLSARHSLHVTLRTSLSARHPLHVTLCTSLSARRPLHVTPCTSLPVRHSLHVTPCTLLSVRQSLHVTLYTSLSACHSPHVIVCTSLSARHSLYVTLCTSLFTYAHAHAP